MLRSSPLSSSRHHPLGASDVQAWMVIKRRQGKHLEIPIDGWPIRQLAVEIVLNKYAQFRVGQGTVFEACGGVGRRKRLGFKPGATGQCCRGYEEDEHGAGTARP